jgi:hypothetical protein
LHYSDIFGEGHTVGYVAIQGFNSHHPPESKPEAILNTVIGPFVCDPYEYPGDLEWTETAPPTNVSVTGEQGQP